MLSPDKQQKGRYLFFLSMAVFAFCMTSCQKDLEDPSGNSEETAIWVLKTKKIQGFATSLGFTPYVTNASFQYDTAARTMIYRDTTDGHLTSEYKYLYNSGGQLIRITITHDDVLYKQVDIHYNSDSLIDKISYVTWGAPHEGTFQWTRQGTNYVGHYLDPSQNTTPFTEGDITFTLNSRKQLIKEFSPAQDPAYDDFQYEAFRDDKGNVTQVKYYKSENNQLVVSDSCVYVRDNTTPSRLSAFYELWGNGITWYKNYYGTNFLVPPVWGGEYFTFMNSLCTKKTEYSREKDANGTVTMLQTFDERFETVYDADKNPIKQTVYLFGEKHYEIEFTWQKIEWLQ